MKVFNNVQLGKKAFWGCGSGLSHSIDRLLPRRNSSAFHYFLLCVCMHVCLCVNNMVINAVTEDTCNTTGFHLIQPAYIYYSLNMAHNLALLLLNEALLSYKGPNLFFTPGLFLCHYKQNLLVIRLFRHFCMS